MDYLERYAKKNKKDNYELISELLEHGVTIKFATSVRARQTISQHARCSWEIQQMKKDDSTEKAHESNKKITKECQIEEKSKA